MQRRGEKRHEERHRALAVNIMRTVQCTHIETALSTIPVVSSLNLHVDHHHISLLHPLRHQHAAQPLHLLQQSAVCDDLLCIRHRGVEYNSGCRTQSTLHVPVHAVVAGVEGPVGKPLLKGGGGTIIDLREGLNPVNILGCIMPILIFVVHALIECRQVCRRRRVGRQQPCLLPGQHPAATGCLQAGQHAARLRLRSGMAMPWNGCTQRSCTTGIARAAGGDDNNQFRGGVFAWWNRPLAAKCKIIIGYCSVQTLMYDYIVHLDT